MKNKQAGKVMGMMLAGALVLAGFSPALAVADGETLGKESTEAAALLEETEIHAVYVNTDQGSDEEDGTAAAKAVKTIEKALTLVENEKTEGKTVQKYLVFVNLKKGQIKAELKKAKAPAEVSGITVGAYDALLESLTKEETAEPAETPKADGEAAETEAAVETETPVEEEETAEAEIPAEEELPSEETAEAETPSEETGEETVEQVPSAEEEAETAETETPTEEKKEETVEAETPGEEKKEETAEAETPTEEKKEETAETETPSEENTTEVTDEADPEVPADTEQKDSLVTENTGNEMLVEVIDTVVPPLSFLASNAIMLPDQKLEMLLEPSVDEKTEEEAEEAALSIAAFGLFLDFEDETMTAEGNNTMPVTRAIGGLPIVGPGNYNPGNNNPTASTDTTNKNNTTSNTGSSTNKNQNTSTGSGSSSGNKGGSSSSSGNRTNTSKTETTIRTESVKTGDTAMVLPLAISSMVSAAVLVLLAYLQTQAKRAESALAWRQFRREHPLNSNFDDSELDF